MTRKIMQFMAFAVVVTLIASCNNGSVFGKYQPIPETGWHKDSLVVFEIPVTDTLHNHNLLISVRNEVDYNYSNIWLFIEIVQPKGKVMKDTFEISLAGPSGKWLGEGFGSLRTRQVMYRRNVKFPVSGIYTVKIHQGMREEILKGISDVGISLEKTGSE